MIRAAAGLLLLALPAVLAAAPKFEFSPSAPIAGEPIEVKLSGASPNQVVLVIAERALGRTNKRHYESSASFLADEKGHIDLTRSAPLSARWRGVDAAGLFWSMEASGKDIPGDLAADVIRFSADTNGDGRIDV